MWLAPLPSTGRRPKQTMAMVDEEEDARLAEWASNSIHIS